MEVSKYRSLLEEELVVAMGCTEPLAVAYAGSLASALIRFEPDRAILKCSNNIIKNVRCVHVPNSEDFNGIKASALLGIFGGDYRKGFSCISSLSYAAKQKAKKFLSEDKIKVENLHSKEKLHIIIELFKNEESVLVEIKQTHLNVCKVIKNGKTIYEKEVKAKVSKIDYDTLLLFDNIYELVNSCDINIFRDLLETQIKYNYDIACHGLESNYGVEIGKAILKKDPGLYGKIIAYTSAASEARMCGCVKPVVINSGSGNQGLSTSLPAIIYAKELHIGEDKLLRALLLANLLTIKQKYKIGTLSAFCGVVSSCCSAGASITYLANGSKKQIQQTISNHLATVPGIICDGAKASCASKIAVCLESALLSFELAMNNKAYENGEGILQDTIDDTITSVGEIGGSGMVSTDDEIMKLLLG